MNDFRVIIAGSRNFHDYFFLRAKLDKLFELRDKATLVIVSGTAQGADRMGEQYAKERGLRCAKYPADWSRYGKSAGYRRNELMAANADALVAFWDGQSRGTKHMIDTASAKGLTVRIVRF